MGRWPVLSHRALQLVPLLQPLNGFSEKAYQAVFLRGPLYVSKKPIPHPNCQHLSLSPKIIKPRFASTFPPGLSDGRQLKGGWRHDIGKKGACANNCCSFNPPTKKANNIQHSEWFEGDCSSAPAKKWTAPFLFQGQNGDVKSVCVQRDGKLEQVEGKLSNCGISNCCIMYENQ